MIRLIAWCLTLSLFVAAVPPAPPATAADWPQFLGPTRDGHSLETNLNWTWPKDGPPIAWKKAIGSGWAAPVVAEGKLIVFHRVGPDEVVAALEPATGKELWTAKYVSGYRDSFRFDDGPRATPLAANGKLYTLGANGELQAWELATGKRLWGKNLLLEYQASKGFFGVACSPILVSGKLLINIGGKGAGIVAFDPATGKELWKATDDDASYSSPTSAEFEGKLAAVFLTRAGLKLLDPTTGKVLHELPWRPRLNESVNAATPLVWKGEVFITVSYATGAVLVQPKAGELNELWSNDKSLSCQYNTPVRVGEYLYGVHGRADVGTAQLRCVEWKTGVVKWSEERFGVASIIAVDSGLLALTEGGELVRFDASPEGYKERARARILDKPTRALPALADGLFFARDGGQLVCVQFKKN